MMSTPSCYKLAWQIVEQHLPVFQLQIRPRISHLCLCTTCCWSASTLDWSPLGWSNLHAFSCSWQVGFGANAGNYLTSRSRAHCPMRIQPLTQWRCRMHVQLSDTSRADEQEVYVFRRFIRFMQSSNPAFHFLFSPFRISLETKQIQIYMKVMVLNPRLIPLHYKCSTGFLLLGPSSYNFLMFWRF